MLPPETGSRNWQQKLAAETGSRNWHLKLAAETGSRNWHLKLAAETGSRNWQQKLAAETGSRNWQQNYLNWFPSLFSYFIVLVTVKSSFIQISIYKFTKHYNYLQAYLLNTQTQSI